MGWWNKDEYDWKGMNNEDNDSGINKYRIETLINQTTLDKIMMQCDKKETQSQKRCNLNRVIDGVVCVQRKTSCLWIFAYAYEHLCDKIGARESEKGNLDALFNSILRNRRARQTNRKEANGNDE